MQAPDLAPISIGEMRWVGFDFSAACAQNVTITSFNITVQVLSGYDPTPAARIIGAGILVTGRSQRGATQVNQLFGNMLGGVIYVVFCAALLSDGQDISIWARWPCQLVGQLPPPWPPVAPLFC